MTTDQMTCPTWCSTDHVTEAAAGDPLETIHNSEVLVIEGADFGATPEEPHDVEVVLGLSAADPLDERFMTVALNGEIYVPVGKVLELCSALATIAGQHGWSGAELAAERNATASGPIEGLNCPIWCTGAHLPGDADGDTTFHPGPRFGWLEFGSTANPDGTVRELACDTQQNEFSTPESLRQLAIDAFTAAAWMEMNR